MRGWLVAALGVAVLSGGARGAPPGENVHPTHHAGITPSGRRALGGPSPVTPRQPAAGRVVTAEFWSQSLGVRKRLLVWLPPSYDTAPARRYPVAIYLHGLGGNETNWTALGALDRTLDSLVASGLPEMIVAMPDGDDGWYTTWYSLGDYQGCRRDFKPRDGDTVDSYCVPWLHYDDYVARDLVQFVDRTWRTDARRERRAIAGLSMGGYGALSIALAYPDVFSVAVSHSGVLSPLFKGPKPFAAPPAYHASMQELEQGWGERYWPLTAPAFGPDTTGWWSRDPARRAHALWREHRARMPAVMVDVGTEDGLLDQNRAFRYEMQRLGIPVQYAEWPGKHDWSYWTAHAPESLRFVAERIAR